MTTRAPRNGDWPFVRSLIRIDGVGTGIVRGSGDVMLDMHQVDEDG